MGLMDIGIDGRAGSVLPEDDYLRLLGACVFLFERLNAFIVELLGYTGLAQQHDWYHLIDMESGRLVRYVEEGIDVPLGIDAAGRFRSLVERRNRIVHGFAVTGDGREQVLVTKTRRGKGDPGSGGRQFVIDRSFLGGFICDVLDLEEGLESARERLRGREQS